MVMTIAVAKARPFENQFIWNQIFNKSGFWMCLHFKWLDFRSPLYSKFFHCSFFMLLLADWFAQKILRLKTYNVYYYWHDSGLYNY